MKSDQRNQKDKSGAYYRYLEVYSLWRFIVSQLIVSQLNSQNIVVFNLVKCGDIVE